MIHVLTTANGQCLDFFVQSCAEVYQRMHGGTITTAHRPMLDTVAYTVQVDDT